ncbi:MAG: hypothetical protein RIT45_3988 [Pseudomonadota bacterium]
MNGVADQSPEIVTADTIALQTHWQTIGFDPAELTIRTDGTLMPTRELLRTHDEHALGNLRPLLVVPAGQGDDAAVDLALGELIGEGGMGVVRAAAQVALGREVAVKSVRPSDAGTRSRESEATLALLREAWVTGQLEHPSVVPVHTLGRADDGAPLLVMKRIVGRAWSELLANPGLLPDEARADPLRFHLEVLMAVCNAVAFAHSRRVLHRDLKPDNVMIGAFGEVYVLDWGLAVALPGGDPRLPASTEIRSIAGTPHFMAPEMVAVTTGQIDERTDIYLLGAILHLVLTGEPRHHGRTPMEILAAAWRSPAFGYDVAIPEELGAICNRATAADPSRRFEDVASFRAAIAAFLQHRHSLEVTRKARRHLERLGQLLARDTPDADDPLAAPTLDAVTADAAGDPSHLEGDERLAAIASAFSAARFGFQLALESWPGNEVARTGRERALGWMFEHELERGDLHAAQMIAAELEAPDPSVRTRLDALRERLRAEQELARARERAVRDMDQRYGTRTRAFLSLIIAVVFGLQAIGAGVAVRTGWLHWENRWNFAVGASFAVLLEWFRRWAKDTLTATDFNRRVVRALGHVAALNLGMIGALWIADADPLAVIAWQMLLFAGFTSTLGASLDPRIMPASVGYFVAFAIATIWPRWTFEATAFGHLVAGGWTTWAWRPERLKGRYDGDTRALREPSADSPEG